MTEAALRAVTRLRALHALDDVLVLVLGGGGGGEERFVEHEHAGLDEVCARESTRATRDSSRTRTDSKQERFHE